jgi:hypothetical protein
MRYDMAWAASGLSAIGHRISVSGQSATDPIADIDRFATQHIMDDWIGSPPLRTLDELAAFDAMRRFLEIWWEVGGRSEDNIAIILGASHRTRGLDANARQGAPLDQALWDDWRDAVSLVMRNGSAPDKDPLAKGG